MAEAIRESGLEVFAGAGHGVFLTEALELIRDFALAIQDLAPSAINDPSRSDPITCNRP